ncbi:unnamed protein product [Psylliodes chrysocephalus]|uniref:Uncharacterized protein n=1 Tax=Psylliodes chrysocephalus TaxID=3402493 RepID=A0A9P0GM90_9CUCU|nr:unnamed protein product [Psylliodes chrysocephala]
MCCVSWFAKACSKNVKNSEGTSATFQNEEVSVRLVDKHDEEEEELLFINSMDSINLKSSWYEQIYVEGKIVKFKLDSGSNMWHIVFLAVFPCIISAGVKPLESLEDGSLWRERIADALLSDDDDFSSENSQIFRHRYPYQIVENTEPDLSMYPRRPSGKRALAMFARWGSINGIGKNRPPIRASNLFDSDDQLSTNSRRMQGQPLRWG